MKIGRWSLVAELGKGTFGSVWRAVDERGGQVALKLISAAAVEPDRVARFVRESQALARVRDDGLVSLIEAGQHEGQPWLALELVEGETLEARLRVRGRLEVREAMTLALHLARTLSRLHAAGVVHRDLKPANVIVRPDGRPVLVDLGLALLLQVDARLTRTGEVLGTPSFLAPELAGGDGRSGGPAVDVYGLGATLWMLLVGRPPFEAPTVMACLARVMSEPAVPPSAERPGLSREVDAVCLRCLAKRPEERFPSADALALELERLLRPAEAPRRPRLGASLAAAVVLVGGGGGAAWLLSRRAPSSPSPPPPAPSPPSALPAPGPARLGQLLDRVRAAIDESKRERALELLEEALSLGPPTVETRLLRAIALFDLHRHAEALGEASAAIQAEPGNAAAWARRAIVRALGSEPGDAAARLEAAREDARRALELDPDCALALVARGLCEEDRGQADLDRAVELAPLDPEVLAGRAEWRRRRLDVPGARADIDRALALRPEYARYYWFRGLIVVGRGEGFSDADRAVQLAQDDPELRALRGQAHIYAGRNAEAVSDLDFAIARGREDRPNPHHYFDRGIARWGAGDIQGGVEDETRALSLSPGMTGAMAFRGRMHLAAGSREPARADYDGCVKEGIPKSWAATLLAAELAVSYLQSGELREAEQLANAALRSEFASDSTVQAKAKSVLSAIQRR